MIKYYKNGSQFKEKDGYYINWITDEGRFAPSVVLPVLVKRVKNGGASAQALKRLSQGFYAAPREWVQKQVKGK